MKHIRLLRLFIICILSLCMWSAQPTQAQDVTSDLLGRINNLRTSLGLSPYTLHPSLTAAAQNHASWMVTTFQVSHTQPDGSTPSSRAAAAGYTSSWVSENIYMGTNATVDSAWSFWMNSPIHYRGITNRNYAEVGIASASGEAGRSYVLVFGNPSGVTYSPPSNNRNSSGGNSANSGASGGGLPAFVVGLDDVGNIMHEIQPGHTLGEIALIYGYSWDDLQRIRDLNGMTEEQGRNLEIGAVLLIPPWGGTYTPTPNPDGAAVQRQSVEGDEQAAQAQGVDANIPYTEDETTRNNFDAVSTPRVVALVTPTPADAVIAPPSPTVAPVITQPLPQTPVREEVANPGSDSWTAATVTPTSGTPVAMVNTQDEGLIPPASAQMTVEDALSDDDGGGVNPMLYVIIGVQIGIVLMAGVEYFRRRG